MRSPRPVARVAALLLLAGFALTALIAGKRGLADVVAQQPRYEFERWQAGKSNPGAAAATGMGDGLRSALALDPDNPNLLLDIGRLDSWQVRNGPMHDSAVRATRQGALENFRRAARLRPTSGHSWAIVAQAKYGAGSVDSEFAAALEQAMRRAPWQAQVQLISIELGLASWQALTVPMQLALGKAIRTQAGWKMVDQKPALFRMIKNYRRSDLACPWAGAAFPCPSA